MNRILYFSTATCAPCRALAPLILELSKTLPITKIDASEDKDSVSAYNIRHVPTFVILKDGKEIGRKSGMVSKEDIQIMASKLL